MYGSLNVESTPGFATVFVDGKEMGETPKFIKDILVGEHELRLTKEGYDQHVETVAIKKNERTQLKLKLQKSANSPKPTPQQPESKPVTAEPVKSVFFVMANYAYSVAPQSSYGITIGSVRKVGWYVSLGSNFDLGPNYGYECDAEGQIETSDFGAYHFNGERTTSYFSANAGLTFRAYDPLYIYLGAGYGQRNLYWKYYPLTDSNDETTTGWS